MLSPMGSRVLRYPSTLLLLAHTSFRHVSPSLQQVSQGFSLLSQDSSARTRKFLVS